ncbi:contact-dependent growth inhibition system immunity protein [Nocardioides zeicaulis]|uniref:Contact-dependent growth inhibition system immunity protein n=1 Tax=Nocardioides zeicaulis TaxID=1776857 RepID=A0ABV6DZE1_9ACTN
MKALEYLMGAYFHQDYDIDGGTSADTVASFTRERTELVRSCVDDIETLLSQSLPEGELRAMLHAWGCDYVAGDHDQDYRDWLREIRDQLDEHLGQPGGGSA